MKVVVLALAVAACTDESPSAPIARDSVQWLGSLVMAVGDKNPFETLQTLDGYASDAQRVVPAPDGAIVVGDIFDPGCDSIQRSCSPAACMFSGSCSGPDGTQELNGAVIRNGDTLEIDVVNSQAGHRANSSIELDGSLQLTSVGLAGTVRVSGNAHARAGADFDVTLEYRAVALDSQGCPTGGSMVATSHYAPNDAAPVSGYASAFDASTTVHFSAAACR